MTPRACGFPVFIEAVRDNGFVLDFGDHAIVNGVLKLRLTNLTSLHSIEINSTGPVFPSLEAKDGLSFATRHAGHTLLTIGPRLSAVLGISPGLYLSTGLVVIRGTFRQASQASLRRAEPGQTSARFWPRTVGGEAKHRLETSPYAHSSVQRSPTEATRPLERKLGIVEWAVAG